MTEILDAVGPWAPAVYVVGFAVVVMVGVPRSALTVVGGVAFGPFLGIALAWTASLIAAVLALLVGRALGEEAVARRAGPRLRRVQGALHGHSLRGVLLTRLTPVPFAVVSYSLGALGVRTRPYVVGTAIGLVPGAIAFGTAGSSVASGRLEWGLAVAAVIALAWLAVRRPREQSPGQSSAHVRPARAALATQSSTTDSPDGSVS